MSAALPSGSGRAHRIVHDVRVLRALDHVILAVSDLPVATRTLARLLGRAPSWRGEHPVLGTENTLFRLSNTYVELLAPLGEGGVAGRLRAHLDAEGEGLVGLAFRTDDAGACHRTLASRGFDPAPPEDGIGRDVESGAWRRWRSVHVPRERTRGILLFAIEHESEDEALAPAQAVGDPRASVLGLDHVVVVTSDVDASRAIYGDGLGLRLALDRTFDERKLRLLFFRVGGVTVELAHPLEAPVSPQDRFMGLSWQVPDLEAARERIVAAGFDVSPVRTGIKPGTRVASVRGRPLGVDTLLIEPAPPAATRLG